LPAKTALFSSDFYRISSPTYSGRFVNATLKIREKIFDFFGQSELRKRSNLPKNKKAGCQKGKPA